MIKQRLYGLGLVLVGVASVLPTGDATAALPLVGLGAWMMCSKRSLLYAPWGIPGRGGRRVRAARRRKNKKSAPAAVTTSAHIHGGSVHSEGHPQYSTFGGESQ